MIDKSTISGWKTYQTKITYKNCTLSSIYTKYIPILGNLNVVATFENCNFNISRYTLALNYGTLIFNKCNFIFNNLNTSKNVVDLNYSGYGYATCPWYFNNCYFETSLPVNIYGGNVVNPTIIGDAKIV